jgi:hypothetical protein
MDSVTPRRTLGIRQRIFLAIACQLWLWANLFLQGSEVEAITVSLVQLAAVILISLRLRHMRALNDRWIRVAILVVVLLAAAVDLTIAGRELAGLSVWFSVAKLIPVAAVLAFASVIYCFFQAPTRITLLLYTVSFVAGMRAVTLMFEGQGNPEAENLGSVVLVEAVVSTIYPLAFIFKGQFSPMAKADSTATEE